MLLRPHSTITVEFTVGYVKCLTCSRNLKYKYNGYSTFYN